MPVTFYPKNPTDRTALSKIIVKKDGTPLRGEIDVYIELFNDLKESDLDWYVWHDLKFTTHSENHNPYKKSESQMDFVLLCKYGICVIEVKGGTVEFHDSEFYFRHDGELGAMKQNPLKQVEGYKYTLKDVVLQKHSQKLFIDLCVFPHTNIDYSNHYNLFGDIIYTRAQTFKQISLLEFILCRYKNVRKKIEQKHHFKFRELSNWELLDICKLLSPTLKDLNTFITNSKTYKWLGLKNFEVFDGLSKNQRILIEGVPGSGKTTFALAYADQRRHLKGLYLCWNKFLKVQIAHRVSERHLGNLEVNTYYSFLKDLGLKTLSYDLNIGEFRDKVSNFFSKKIDKQYDYIIIDEGQDIINRGVESLLDVLTANGDGLFNGNLLFLCDSEQAYSLTNEKISENIDILSMYFTHFQMNHAHRSVNNPQIRELAVKILEDVYILNSKSTLEKFPNMIFRFDSFKKAKKQMVKDFLHPIRNRDNSLRGKDCILLVESSLLVEDNLDELLMNDCEEMDSSNVTDLSNVLRYLSPLKFKGLEKDNVGLIISSPSMINQHEIYVGITRAKRNLKIYIVDE